MLLAPQNDNVLLVPSRNVLLTGARWGVGNGSTSDDPERARPSGGAEESQEAGGRVFGQETRNTGEPGDIAQLDDGGPAVASEAEAHASSCCGSSTSTNR